MDKDDVQSGHPSLGGPILLTDNQFDLGDFLRAAMKVGLIELGDAMVISSAISFFRDAFEGELEHPVFDGQATLVPTVKDRAVRDFGLITKERLLNWKGMS